MMDELRGEFMYYEESIGLRDRLPGSDLVKRTAVKAYAIREDRILMVKTNEGAYITPGGGVQEGEDLEASLKREVEEETGYKVDQVLNRLGQVFVRKEDRFEPHKTFEQITYVYLVDLHEEKGLQRLEAYEKDLGFEACWVPPRLAYEANGALMKAVPNHWRNIWLELERVTLHHMMTYLEDLSGRNKL